MNKTDDVTVPGQPEPGNSQLIRNLTILASALTATGIAVNLILQIAHFAKKRPVQPDQRDKIEAAGLLFLVLRTVPGLVKQVRLLADQVKKST